MNQDLLDNYVGFASYVLDKLDELRPNLKPLEPGSMSAKCNDAQLIGGLRRIERRARELGLLADRLPEWIAEGEQLKRKA